MGDIVIEPRSGFLGQPSKGSHRFNTQRVIFNVMQGLSHGIHRVPRVLNPLRSVIQK